MASNNNFRIVTTVATDSVSAIDSLSMLDLVGCIDRTCERVSGDWVVSFAFEKSVDAYRAMVALSEIENETMMGCDCVEIISTDLITAVDTPEKEMQTAMMIDMVELKQTNALLASENAMMQEAIEVLTESVAYTNAMVKSLAGRFV